MRRIRLSYKKFFCILNLSIYDKTLAAREAADKLKKAALEAKEAALCMESAINEYLKEQSMQEKLRF